MSNIKLDITKAACFLEAGAVKAFEPQVKAAQQSLEEGTCPGNDFLGWLHLPSSITPAFLDELQACADVLRQNCEAVVVAGIGRYRRQLSGCPCRHRGTEQFVRLAHPGPEEPDHPVCRQQHWRGLPLRTDRISERQEVRCHQHLVWYHHRDCPDLPPAQEAV